MKKTCALLVAGLLPAIGAISYAGVESPVVIPEAPSNPGSWYVSALGGANFVNDLEIEYPTLISLFGADIGHQNLDMNTGYIAGLTVGYMMPKEESGQWSFELETTFRNNTGNGDALLNFPGQIPSRMRHVDADLDQFGLMLNARRTFSPWKSITPYLGVGVGGTYADLSLTQYAYTTGGTLLNTISVDDDELLFAYQAMAGIEVPINDCWSFYTEYRFTGTQQAKFDVRQGSAGGNTNVSDNLMNHSLLIGFRATF